ncbi:hypothetical protein AAFP35_08450 [Gordonia sp. CPCC 206044]|uniref:hypothetical protein n=1 Tax=Gordonia sp. CPCC 206044 TaxID=3140793 RepID=UPI003AF3D52B
MSSSSPGGAPQVRRPGSLVFSTVAVGLVAAISFLYAIVVTVVLINNGHAWHFVTHLLSGRAPALMRSFQWTWVLSLLVFALLVITAMFAAVARAARVAAAFLSVVSLVILVSYFLIYIIGGQDWFGMATWLFVLAWVFPLVLAIAMLGVLVSFFFGWSYFAERDRARGGTPPPMFHTGPPPFGQQSFGQQAPGYPMTPQHPLAQQSFTPQAPPPTYPPQGHPAQPYPASSYGAQAYPVPPYPQQAYGQPMPAAQPVRDQHAPAPQPFGQDSFPQQPHDPRS